MDEFSAKLEQLRELVFESRYSLKEFIDNPMREISTTDSTKFVNSSLEYSTVMFQNTLFDLLNNWVIEADDEDDEKSQLWNHYRVETADIITGEKYLYGLLFLKGKSVKVDQDRIDKLEEEIEHLEEDLEDYETEVFKLRSRLESSKKRVSADDDSY